MKTIEFDSVTTKGGDKGFTSLFDGKRIPKTHPTIILLGAIDSLNASVGITRCDNEFRQYDKNVLSTIQNDLYTIMSNISGCSKPFGEDRVEYLERKQRLYMRCCKIPTMFINFGDHPTSAGLNSLRTSVRSVESIYSSNASDPIVMKYFNRLSDLIYVLSLVYENKAKKKMEKQSLLSKILRHK